MVTLSENALRESARKPAWTSTDLLPGKQKGTFVFGQWVFLRTTKAIYSSCKVVNKVPAGFLMSYMGRDRKDKPCIRVDLVPHNSILELRPYAKEV